LHGVDLSRSLLTQTTESFLASMTTEEQVSWLPIVVPILYLAAFILAVAVFYFKKQDAEKKK
jgi:hypothetical protein